MKSTARGRFIAGATVWYVVLALAWIFLSDHLLEMFTDRDTIVRLSTAKGLFFVLVTGAMWFLMLHAVPSADAGSRDSLLGAMAAGLTAARRTRWLLYAFAFCLPLALLWTQGVLPGGLAERPMLVAYMLPIVICALLGGLGPGLVATAVSALGVHYFFQSPQQSWRLASGQELVQWSFLLVDGVAVSLLSHLLHRTLHKVGLQRQLLDAIVSGTSDAVFIKDMRGRYVLANAAAAAYVGRAEGGMLGCDDRALFPAEEAEQLMQTDRDILAQGQARTQEERLRIADGRSRVFQVTKGPVRDAEGRVQGLFGISRDVTAERSAEEALREREQQLARVIEGSEQGYWDWDLKTQAFRVSARWETMLGYAAGEMDVAPEHWDRYLHPDDAALAREALQRHLKGHTPRYEVELRCRRKEGGWCWILARGRVVAHDPDGTPRCMSGTHTDITERKLLELAQREASTVFMSSYEGIMVVDAETRIVKVNPAFTRITGFTEQEVLGRSPRMLASGRHDPAFYRAMWESVRAYDFWRGEIWNRRKNGELYAQLLSISVVRDGAGAVQHYVGAFSDISQIKAHEAELSRIAHFDALTGLPNRRLLADRLEQAINRSSRSGRAMAVCFLDLDGFKAVNDLLGHAAGDELLAGVAENLKLVMRADDTLARLGGDEFVLILSDVDTPEECGLILDRVLAAARAPVVLAGSPVRVSASIGVSMYPLDDSDAQTLLHHADQAMYAAKQAGRDRYHLFDPESDRKAQQHRKALDRVRQAFEAEEFTLFYQPQVDLLSGQVLGMEALLRWRHPQEGMLLPRDFMGAITGGPLEQPLGDWALQAALDQARAWQAEGVALSVGVNVGSAQLQRPDFTPRLREALGRCPPLAPDSLCLELRESAAVAEQALIAERMQDCRALGVAFALDEFGSSAVTLACLRRLPATTWKIDPALVLGMLDDAARMQAVEDVVRLAAAFRRSVIAEGVETPAHAAALLALGCTRVQGVAVAAPMPAEQVLPWLRAWRSEARWRSLAPPVHGVAV